MNLKTRRLLPLVSIVLSNGAPAGAAPRLSFKGDSDAHIVRGLIAILFAIYSGRCADEIVRIDAEGVFWRLGLAEHLRRSARTDSPRWSSGSVPTPAAS